MLIAAGTGAVVAATGLGTVAWIVAGRPVTGMLEGLAPTMAASATVADLTEQATRLNAENVVLRTRLRDYQEIAGESGVPAVRQVVVRARVIARTQRAARRWVELDVGSVDGVVKGMPVGAGWSLLGVVAGVKDGSCLVQELTDAESRVPAAVFDGERKLAEGVVAGTGARRELRLDLIEDQPGLAIAPGMSVVTLATDQGIPAGLVLGTVHTSQTGTTGDHWRITVTPLRTTLEVESVLVLRFAGR